MKNEEKIAQAKNLSRSDIFHIFSRRVSLVAGHWSIFIIAFISIIVWLISGYYFNYSDTWQLVINTGTTIITFLMVFIIQNTQNRDSKNTQLKLDELIRVHKLAQNSIIDLEKLTNKEIEELEDKYKSLSEKREQNRERAR